MKGRSRQRQSRHEMVERVLGGAWTFGGSEEELSDLGNRSVAFGHGHLRCCVLLFR